MIKYDKLDEVVKNLIEDYNFKQYVITKLRYFENALIKSDNYDYEFYKALLCCYADYLSASYIEDTMCRDIHFEYMGIFGYKNILNKLEILAKNSTAINKYYKQVKYLFDNYEYRYVGDALFKNYLDKEIY